VALYGESGGLEDIVQIQCKWFLRVQ
jgi:hypothetical protein